MAISDIDKSPVDHERYYSLFSFDVSILEYVKLNKSVSGYNGNLHAECMWFDIDNENLTMAKASVKSLIQALNAEYEVHTDDMFIYFSGKKGFHLALLSKLFGGIEPGPELHKRMKDFALSFNIPDIDTKIYDPVRLFRADNSINAKSGLYKVQILYDEIDIAETLATQPRQLKRKFDLLINPKLQNILKENLKFFAQPEVGNRNNKLFRLACLLFSKGLDKSAVTELINAMNRNGLPQREVDTLIDSANKYRQKDTVVLKPFYDWIPQWEAGLREKRDLTTIFPSIDRDIKSFRGKLGAFVGYGGTKKSLCALNILLLNAYHGKRGIYSTMEMPTRELMSRIVDYSIDAETNASELIKEMDKEKVLEILRETIIPMYGDRLLITENGRLEYDEYEAMVERTIRELGSLDILVVDGLSMMGGSQKEVERNSENSRNLKQLANKYNIFVVMICHVARGMTKHSRDVNSLIRGSEKILDDTDFTWNFSLLIDKPNSMVDQIEYRNDLGYIKCWNKRGTGQTTNIIYSFDSKKLKMEETNLPPFKFEVDIKTLKASNDVRF